MNTETTTTQTSEFILRRFNEPVEWHALVWPVLFGFTVLFFILAMRRDDRGAFLRISGLVTLLGIASCLALLYFVIFEQSPWALVVLGSTLGVGLIYFLLAVLVLVFIGLLGGENPLVFLAVGGGVMMLLSAAYVVLGYFMLSVVSWLIILVPVLGVGLIYTAMMYTRDCHSISIPWAGLLALLRLSVYGLLTACFLLPAIQTYDVTATESKIVVLIDVSDSMDYVDSAADRSRLDYVIEFLTRPYARGKDGAPKTYIEHLQEIAPVAVYRVGGQADNEPAEFKAGAKPWDAERWQAWLAFRADKNGEPSLLANELWKFEKAKREPTKDEAEQAGLDKMKFVAHVKTIKHSTDVGGSVKQVLDRESASRLQAVFVFSDGKSNVADLASVDEVVKRAADKNKPFHIFTLGVGDYRPSKEMEVAPIIVPNDRRIDDLDLVVGVPFSGKGLAGKEFEVFLYATRVKDANNVTVPDPQTYLVGFDKNKFNDGPVAGYQSDLKIAIPDLAPGAIKELAKKVLAQQGKGAKGKDKDAGTTQPPPLDDTQKKAVLGEWEFFAKVQVPGEESFSQRRKFLTTVGNVKINENAIRILLFSSVPSRDFTFVKNVFARELKNNRVELAVYLQSNKDDITEVTEDAQGIIWLPDFPTRLDRPKQAGKEGGKDDKKAAKGGIKSDPMNLKTYDVIVAFDADWEALIPGIKSGKESQLALVKEWVMGEHRGGLVFVSGPQYTARLIPPADKDKLKTWPLAPVFDVMPVVLKRPSASLKNETLHDSTIPYALHFLPEAAAFDFLQLDQTGKGALAGWDDFFARDPGKKVERGFFTYYRVDDVKTGAVVLATFADPKAPPTSNPKYKEQPYFVVLPFGSAGKTFFIGSGEMWRLRTFKEDYHQVFWQNLTRYISARTSGKSFGTFQMQSEFEPGPVAIEAEVRDKEGMPLDPKKHGDLKVIIQRIGAGAKDEDLIKVPLKAKHPTEKPDGKFVATAEIRTPGRYEAKIMIPGTNESIRKEFSIVEKGAEKADLSTDFLKLQMLASEPTPDMRRRLQERAEAKQVGGENGGPPAGWSSQRLYFPLRLADMTTECLVRTPAQIETRKGPTKDVWDLGPLVYDYKSWDDAPLLYTLLLAVPGALMLAAGVVMAFSRRWWAVLGLVITLILVEIGLMLLAHNFTPSELFNPSRLGVLLVVPTLIALVAAGILLVAERYTWVIAIVAAVAVYLLGFVVYLLLFTAPDWFYAVLPVDFVWLLLLIGFLLSLEWFTRKMLRLA
jgi:hypothetical protein